MYKAFLEELQMILRRLGMSLERLKMPLKRLSIPPEGFIVRLQELGISLT